MLVDPIRKRHFEVIEKALSNKSGSNAVEFTEIQKNMTISGTHDSDCYNFIDVAIKNVGGQSLSKLGVYYFFKRCDSNPEEDDKFNTEVEISIKGNSDDISFVSSQEGLETLIGQKKRAYTAIANLSDVAQSIVDQLKETNRLSKVSTDTMKQTNLITLATAAATTLGNKELLQALLGNLTNPSSTENDSNE